MGPGSLFTSTLPPLLVPGIAEAVRAADVPRIYVCNLLQQPGETEGYRASDHVARIIDHVGLGLVDTVVVSRNRAEFGTPVPVDRGGLRRLGHAGRRRPPRRRVAARSRPAGAAPGAARPAGRGRCRRERPVGVRRARAARADRAAAAAPVLLRSASVRHLPPRRHARALRRGRGRAGRAGRRRRRPAGLHARARAGRRRPAGVVPRAPLRPRHARAGAPARRPQPAAPARGGRALDRARAAGRAARAAAAAALLPGRLPARGVRRRRARCRRRARPGHLEIRAPEPEGARAGAPRGPDRRASRCR